MSVKATNTHTHIDADREASRQTWHSANTNAVVFQLSTIRAKIETIQLKVANITKNLEMN